MRGLAPALLIAALFGGAARAGTVDVDFNPKAEFQRYRTWAWAPGRDESRRGVLADATMRERVEKQLAIRLREAGLKAVAPSDNPDLLVNYRGDTGTGRKGRRISAVCAAWTTPRTPPSSSPSRPPR